MLVTGAGGSIGSEISHQVARYQPGRLLLLDRDETLLHDVAIGPLGGAETILLDLCDRDRVVALLEETRPEVVFHAAANKHVPILERHATQAANTNVLSTWWLANAAAENGCQRFVHLSTDKAAHPCSVMGATKRAAEHIVVGVGRRHDLPYAAVRFGNVLGSRGSVVPTFLRQILDGGPVTVTSEDMTRYFMTIPEAVSLVLQAGAMADRGRIFLLDMGEPASILGLARQMIRLAGLRPDDDIPIEITGVRPGERLHERLYDEAEEHEPADHPSISVLRPKLTLDWERLVRAMDELERCCRDDDEAVRQALMDMLGRCGVDCRLEPWPTASDHAMAIDVGSVDTEAARAAERAETVPANGARRRSVPSQLALLSGTSTDGPGLPFARPARPPLERVVQRRDPLLRERAAHQRGAGPRARGAGGRSAARRPRRGRELVHVGPDAGGAGAGRGPRRARSCCRASRSPRRPTPSPGTGARRGSSSAIRTRSRSISPTRSRLWTAPAPSCPPTCSARPAARRRSRSWRRRPGCRSCSTPRTPSGRRSTSGPSAGSATPRCSA